MRTAIVAAIAAIFFQTMLVSVAPAVEPAASGIREEILVVTPEPYDPSRAGGPNALARPAAAAPLSRSVTPQADEPNFTIENPNPAPMNQLWTAKTAPVTGYSDLIGAAAFLMVGVIKDEEKRKNQGFVEGAPGMTLEEFFGNAQSQHIFTGGALASFFPWLDSGSTRSAPPNKPALFIASIAASSVNSDHTLFIGAVPLARRPLYAQAKLYRINLTELVTGKHFCTPAADAFVLSPRVAVSAAGRLFIAFDSLDGANTVGSVLSFDLAALVAGGAAKGKCFTGAPLAGLTPPNVRDTNSTAFFIAAPEFSSVIKRFKHTIGLDPAHDTLRATPDIAVTGYSPPQAAVQPNGVNLYPGSAEFRNPSIQIGNAFWNVHTVDDGNGHSKIRIYKFSPIKTTPLMMTTLGTLADHSDDLFAPSFDIMTSPKARAYVTFARTISGNATTGKATIMLAKGPNSSSTGWTSVVVAKSTSQFTKTWLNQPCDTYIYAGCSFMQSTSTLIDPIESLVFSAGPIIINGDGSGKETNWQVRGVAKPQ